MTTMNDAAYIHILKQDIKWLESVPDSLEKGHILHTLQQVIEKYEPKKEQDQ